MRTMTDLRLEVGEGILLQTNGAGIYDGNNEIDVDELYLTNKSIVYVYEKSTGMFKSETAVDRIPLSQIAVVNGVVQVEQVDDDDYGMCLQIIYTSGKRVLLEIYGPPKKQHLIWKAAIADAIIRITTGAPALTKPVPPIPQEETKETALFAGLKDAVDSVKQTFREATQTAIETFNSVSDTTNSPTTVINEKPGMEEKKYIFCCH